LWLLLLLLPITYFVQEMVVHLAVRWYLRAIPQECKLPPDDQRGRVLQLAGVMHG
jgi:hypothetical protein